MAKSARKKKEKKQKECIHPRAFPCERVMVVVSSQNEVPEKGLTATMHGRWIPRHRLPPHFLVKCCRSACTENVDPVPQNCLAPPSCGRGSQPDRLSLVARRIGTGSADREATPQHAIGGAAAPALVLCDAVRYGVIPGCKEVGRPNGALGKGEGGRGQGVKGRRAACHARVVRNTGGEPFGDETGRLGALRAGEDLGKGMQHRMKGSV